VCGRYTLSSSKKELMKEFGLVDPPFDDHAPRYNIAPTQLVLALAPSRNGLRSGLLRWGLIPGWAEDARIGSRMINARAETLTLKPAFRELLARRRCVILADGFYEWKRTAHSKQPMHIRLASGKPFAFAGLWDRSSAQLPGGVVHTCTIITTEPNELIGHIHDRMPVILDRNARERWLDISASPEELMAVLKPYDGGEELVAYEVSDLVNAVSHDSPALITPENKSN
jgi:putative SOS response-associated peptidase YedK